MTAGRPRTNGQDRLAELEDLADWFKQALATAGHPSVNAFLTALRDPRHRTSASGPLPSRKTVYEVAGALALPELETVQYLAQALGSAPAAVTPRWLRARRALDRKELARRRRPGAAPVPTTWESLPLPDPLLEDLLRSQASAAEQFPYDLLGVRKPPLSEIYVEQDFQPLSPGSPAADRGGETLPRDVDDAPPTLAAVLAGHDHLFITGGPGAGKTTLGRHLVRQIARYWLREPDAGTPWCPQAVVAVRVTAADLLTPHAWSRQLSDAVARAGTLLSPVDRSHFEARVHGVPWLVVVDGLDEVASPAVRRRLLEKLAEQVRPQPHGTYRLVITSRPLPQEELAPFAGLPGLGFYTLRGFDADQRHVFAERWFAAQGDADPAGQADAFASDIEDASLEDVLQVPLLATIAAAFRSRNPGRAFPRGLVELYESFLADLDNAREGNAAVLGGFLDRWTERGYGEMAAWLVRNQDRLLTHLAWQRTAGRPPASLLDAALVWLDRHLPAGLEWPLGAEGELGQFLARSGVVAFDGQEVSFLHQSFAEFLASRDEAASIPADFPDFRRWSTCIGNASNSNRALFTLALWARRPENDVAVVVRRLLAGGPSHRIMALRLVASGVPLGQALEGAVIERLLDFARVSKRADHRPTSTRTLMAELTLLRGHHRLAARLRTIAVTAGMDIFVRAEAAWAYAHVGNLPEGVRLLKAIGAPAPGGDASAILASCRHIAALDPQEGPFVEAALRTVLADPGADVRDRLTAADRLLKRGSIDGLAELAREVLSGPPVDGRVLRRAGELWLDAAGPVAAPEVAAAAEGRGRAGPWETAGLAMLLLRCDRPEQALPLARRAFEESIDDEDINDLVELWLELRGAQGADELAAMAPGLRNWNHDDRDSIALTLRFGGFIRQASEIVEALLEQEEDASLDSDRPHRVSPAHLFDPSRPESVAEVLAWADRLDAGPGECAQMLSSLQHDEAPEEALLPLARRIVHHPGCDENEFAQAAAVLLVHDTEAGCEELLAALPARPYESAALRARLLPILAEHGAKAAVVEAAVMELGTRVLGDPGVTAAEIEGVVRAWLKTAGSAGVHEAVKRIEATGLLTPDQTGEVAALLLELGEAGSAVPLWCRIITTPGTAVQTRWKALGHLITAEAGAPAERALRTALATSPPPAETLTLRRLLAWLKAEA